HHKLLLRGVGFRRKDGNGYKTLPYSAVLEMTKCRHIEATIRKSERCFAGALVRQKDTRLPKRVVNGRVSTGGSKEAGRPPKQWEDTLQENI
ncbi:unnamed protein product, partial [Sphacelaria rigidula]